MHKFLDELASELFGLLMYAILLYSILSLIAH